MPGVCESRSKIFPSIRQEIKKEMSRSFDDFWQCFLHSWKPCENDHWFCAGWFLKITCGSHLWNSCHSAYSCQTCIGFGVHMSALPSKLSQNNGNTNIREEIFFMFEHIELLLQLSGVFAYWFGWLLFYKYTKFNMVRARAAWRFLLR